MTPKFHLGDPVWARSHGSHLPAGEYAATIVLACYSICDEHNCPLYGVALIDSPKENHCRLVCEVALRPRRDDYQQHEPRISRADLDQSLASATVAELIKELS